MCLLLAQYFESSADLSFKFVLSAGGIVGYIILFFHSALQMQSKLFLGGLIIFGLLCVLDLLNLVAALLATDRLVFRVDGIKEMRPLFYTLLSSIFFYLIIAFMNGWNTSGEQRLTTLFIALLASLLVVEKVVGVSLEDLTNIILAIFLLYIHVQFTSISIQSMYPHGMNGRKWPDARR